MTNERQVYREAGKHRPIRDDEAESLVVRAKGADQAAVEELVLRYQRLIVVVARGHATADNPFDDLVQEGTIALLDCIRRYEPGRSFGRYFQTALRNRYLKMRRQTGIRKRGWVGSLDDEETGLDEPVDPRTDAPLLGILAGADKRDAFLVKLCSGLVTGSNETIATVADVLGLSRNAARLAIVGAKERCRLACS